MKQFKTIFGFEYGSYAKNKVFVGLTAILIIIMAVVLFFPRLKAGADISVPSFTDNKPKNIALCDNSGESSELTVEYIKKGFQNANVMVVTDDLETLKYQVNEGTYDFAVVLEGPLKYKYVVENAGITDMTELTLNEILTQKYKYEKMMQMGLSAEDTAEIMSVSAESEAVITGKDQSQSFFYTYILLFLLYFAVILYGQFVAQSVAVEKSSRAMELLVTSAKPSSLMFGKVMGAGMAGLTQFVLLLGSAYVFYALNKDFWADNMIINSIFGMPVSMLLYTMLFFVLGFFLYSFMYGALASLASRLEDMNTLVLPVTFMMIISFMVTIFSMIGNVDSVLIKVVSFIPFTSPMAMFTRIAMGSVSTVEIIISVVILIVTTVGIGYLAAAIYKIGVLMYGKPPKLNELFRALKNNKSKV